MNRFVIVGGLPYLIDKGKTFSCRWNDEGFTVGAEVELASVPDEIHGEDSVFALCSCLDSIGTAKPTEKKTTRRRKNVEE